MITTRDLQQANEAVTTARNAQPFDQTAYDIAHGAYLRLLDAWAKEGAALANEARDEMRDSAALRRLFGE